MHRLQIRFFALVCALGVVATSVVATVDEPVADAAIVSDPCDRLTVLGADGRASSPRPETVVQVYPTGAICEFEQRVLETMAADRGTTLTDEIRGELLSYGRDEVRARLFAELFDLADRGGILTDPVEIGALDWFVARYAELREQTALNALAEYDKWAADKCSYEAPEGYDYNPRGSCDGITALFTGGPNPPSYDDFVTYGVAVTSDELLARPGVAVSLARVLKTLALVQLYSTATTTAVALAVALAPIVKSVVFPYVSAKASIAGTLAGPAAFLVLVVALSIMRGVELAKNAQIPIKLAEDVEANASVGLTDLIAATTTADGTSELLLALMNATSPDYPTPDPVAVPPSDPDPDTPLWLLPDGSLSPTFTFIAPDNGVNRAWVKDRWFVVQPIDPAGPIRLEPELSYRNHDGSATTARFVDGKLLVESSARYNSPESLECSPPRCEFLLEIEHLIMGAGPEPSTAVFAGSPPMIVAGPTASGPDPLEPGDVVTLTAEATDIETDDDDLVYTWEVAGDGFDAVSTRVGKTVQHRFAGAGEYTVTVTVTDEAGAQASASVDVEVVLPSTELTARTQRFFAGEWRNLALIQGQPGRLVVTSTRDDVCISVDWDGDGVIDDSIDTAENTVTFDTPSDLILAIGIVPVELVANLGGCDGEEIDRATVSVEVLNSPPYDVVAELYHPDDGWQVRSSPESAPTYEEGTDIEVRLRASDDGGPDPLRFVLFWRPGGPVPIHQGALDADPPADGVNTVGTTFITAIDQRTVDPTRFDLVVAAEDSFGQTSTEVPSSYFNIANVAPTIEQIDTTHDNLGNVTLVARVSDQGIAQLDVERISIDWGDGSAPEDVAVDSSIGDTYFFFDVVGQGVHRYTAPGPYTVTVTAFDDETSVQRSIALTLPFQPVISDITELDVDVEGSLTTLGVEVDDPDTAPEDLSVTVDWGDGSSSPAVHVAGTNTFIATTTFAELGRYAVAIEANDGEFDAVPFEGSVTVGDAPPTVVIDQAATQADPTSRGTVAFDVTFSEPVTGFDADDVALSGSAGATSVSVVNSGDDTAFRVDVTGMTSTGTIVAEIEDGAAINANDTPSLASTSTDNVVTFISPIEIALPGVDGVVSVDNDAGQAGATVSFTVSATGGSAPPVVTCVPAAGSFFPIGDTTVRCTADDGGPDVDEFAPTSSLMATADFVVRVVDVDPPAFTTDPTTDGGVGAASSDGEPVTVTYPVPAATDNAGAVTTVCTPASGTLFPVGSTTVTCTVSDTAGNSETTSFVVVVADQTATSTTGPTTTTPTTPTVPATVPATPTPNDPTPDGAGAPGGPVFELPATGTSPRTIVLLALALLLMGAFLVRTRRCQPS